MKRWRSSSRSEKFNWISYFGFFFALLVLLSGDQTGFMTLSLAFTCIAFTSQSVIQSVSQSVSQSVNHPVSQSQGNWRAKEFQTLGKWKSLLWNPQKVEFAWLPRRIYDSARARKRVPDAREMEKLVMESTKGWVRLASQKNLRLRSGSRKAS